MPLQGLFRLCVRKTRQSCAVPLVQEHFHVSVRPFSFLISHNGDKKVVLARVKRLGCLNNASVRAACDEEEVGSLIQMEAHSHFSPPPSLVCEGCVIYRHYRNHFKKGEERKRKIRNRRGGRTSRWETHNGFMKGFKFTRFW